MRGLRGHFPGADADDLVSAGWLFRYVDLRPHSGPLGGPQQLFRSPTDLSGDRKVTVAREPVVSVLTEAAEGRCVT
jgi:hypothetical protein